VFGHDPDPVGDMNFEQPDGKNTFSELFATLFDMHLGAACVGLLSLALLIVWDKTPRLKKSVVPAPLLVVGVGLALGYVFESQGSGWTIEKSHLVQMPVMDGFQGIQKALLFPDFSGLTNPSVYLAALTIAIVASLETLLNLEAIDKIDPEQRHSPPNRELFAQGAGNIVCGLLGGLPITSVIVRSSVNLTAGGKTRASAVFHGFLLAGSVAFIPGLLGRIPLACLGAILLFTGFKLASPDLFKKMYREGRTQFLPFAATIVAIVMVDLLIGVIVGLCVSVMFILHSNFRRPLHQVIEHHISGDVLRIRLASQVSFFSRAALSRALDTVPRGGHVLIDAQATDYIDADVLDVIDDFKNKSAPAHDIDVSLMGFKERYLIENEIQFVDYTSRDLQAKATPAPHRCAGDGVLPDQALQRPGLPAGSADGPFRSPGSRSSVVLHRCGQRVRPAV
jgi:carbonic anhydrase/SulP family sulfate permease